MSLLSSQGAGVGQNGESSHTAQRATAHHSLLRLASVGLCNSGTGKPTAPLKKREAAYSSSRPNSRAAGRDVSLERVRGAAASGLDSPEQGESIQRNYVIFNVAKQEGSPILKRSER